MMKLPVNRITRKWFDLEDNLFEKLLNVDFSGQVLKDQMLNESQSKEHATAYQAVWTSNARLLLSQFPKKLIKGYSFIDVGCGKGKPCFFANMYPFESIEGFDFEEVLVEQANHNLDNLRLFNKSRITFNVGDAASYKLEEKPYVIFLFNPFSDEILNSFLRNNLELIKQHQSYICYANDKGKSTLARFGFEKYFTCEERNLSIWKIN